MRVCYIDDNEECLNNFKDKYKDVLCENDFSFMRHPNEYIGSEDVADIVMLDVELGSEGNGLDYLDCITKKSGYTQIVIVTAYTEKYIEDIFMQKENVAGFLKKPIDMETMVKVLAKAEMIIRNKKAEVIVRTGKYEYVTLKADDILFIESAGHNLNYITRTKEYTTQGKLDDLNGQLPPFFVRCHKSYFVNLNKIKGFTGEFVLIEGKPDISVSRSKKAEFIEAYRNHLRK